jgi:hypothetical protein
LLYDKEADLEESLWVTPEMIQPQQIHLLPVLWSSLPLALMAAGAWWL